jgi:hypothetical protein
VAANLSDPQTELPRLFRELEHAARTVIPVSKVQARVFTQMADTFGALSRDPKALRDTIAKGPSTEAVATDSLRVQRPFLNDLAKLSVDLRGATHELRAALPTVNRALKVGIPVLRRSPDLDARLARALVALRDLARAPTTLGALRGLTATVTTLQPTLRYVGPFATVCNGWNQFWTFAAEHFTAPDETGGTERVMANDGAPQDDSVTSIGANEFVHGHGTAPGVNGGRPQILHGNTYGGSAINPQGNASCSAGQDGYIYAGNPLTPNKDVYGRDVVTQQRALRKIYPGWPPLGPTFAHYDKQARGFGRNPNHVPDGETFTNVPGGLGVEP